MYVDCFACKKKLGMMELAGYICDDAHPLCSKCYSDTLKVSSVKFKNYPLEKYFYAEEFRQAFEDLVSAINETEFTEEVKKTLIKDAESFVKRTRDTMPPDKIEKSKQARIKNGIEQKKNRDLSSMLITSGFTFDGYRIVKYSGYISGDDAVEVPRGIAVFGQNSESAGQNLTDALVKIRRQALKELKEAAYDLGCNAVIGVDFDYITLEPETASISGRTTYLPYVFCVTANGNAVVIEKDDNSNSSINLLKQYKELLDTGVITQEEFDKKKKELL